MDTQKIRNSLTTLLSSSIYGNKAKALLILLEELNNCYSFEIQNTNQIIIH